MLPNSFSFLAFFAVLAVVYYALPHRLRWPLLLLASLYFYATFDPRYLLLLFGVTAVAYAGGLLLEGATTTQRRKVILWGSVVAVVGTLGFFKYWNFFVDSTNAMSAFFASVTDLALFPSFPRLDLVLAIGLSFYTFSCLSYLVDVYRARLPAERHFGHFALYVSFFPKLLAGPIERAQPFLEQIKQPVHFSAAGVSLGLQLMLWGLFKKVVIADRLAVFVDATYSQAAFASPADLLIATYFFAFQLYCDFSGYSDMAIGASMVLGIQLMNNFRRPYLATSTKEFWGQRWHLSLGTWFRDYLYIPMGGSRASPIRKHVNIMTVFLVSGLWHGASWTFVVWGGLNGLYHVISDLTRSAREKLSGLVSLPAKVQTWVSVLITFHLILPTWVFFRAESLTDATTVFSRVAGALGNLPSMLQARFADMEIVISVALIALLMLIEALDERRPWRERLAVQPTSVRWGVYYAACLLLLILGSWQLQSFVYMQF